MGAKKDKKDVPVPLAKEQLDELEALCSKFKFDDSDFDEDVIDAKCGEASEINNGGFRAQIEYLCEGMTLKQAKEFLAVAAVRLGRDS